MVHPFATKQLRQPADPGNKTEPTDLMAMVRAVVVGYSTREQDLPEAWARWRLVSREREDRVNARRRLRVQVAERLHAVMPGYSLLVDDFWQSSTLVFLARHYRSAEALQGAGPVTIADALREDGHPARSDSIARALQWALQAPPAQPCADLEREFLADQFLLLDTLDAQIEAYERQLAQYLVDTPGILLLSMQGVNVVSAGSYMAELGPIEHYTRPSKITGRAGLYPSRYQSDTVDRPNGPLVGHHNARLRDAILEVAHNLLRRNHCFRAWAAAREDPKESRTKVHVAAACKFTRISYWMLAGRQVFTHPAQAPRDAVLHKLLKFGRGHRLEPEKTGDLLRRAARQLPGTVIEDEARALASSLGRRPLRRRCKGPVRIGEVLRDVIRDLAPGLVPEFERSAMAGQQLGRSLL
jgi:transposase